MRMIRDDMRKKIWMAAVIAIVLVLLVQSMIASGGTLPVDSLECTPLQDGWVRVYEDAHSEPVDTSRLQDNRKGERMVVKNRLPEDLGTSSPALMIGISQQTLRVLLDGEELYCFEAQPAGFSPQITRMVMRTVPLPAGSGGKELTLETYSPYWVFSKILPTVYYGSRSDMVLHFLIQESPKMFSGIVLVVVGAFFWAVSNAVGKRRRLLQDNANLAACSLSIGLWLLTECRMLAGFVNNYILMYYINYLSYVFIPIFLLRFLRGSCHGTPRRVVTGVLASFRVLLSAGLIGELTRWYSFAQLQIPINVMILAGSLIVFIAMLPRTRAKLRTWMRALMPALLFSSVFFELFFMYRNVYTLEESNTYTAILNSFLLVIYLIAAGCYYLVKAVYKDTQVRSLERQLNAQADHYTRLQRSQEELRVFRHNVKNDLLCLDTLLARGEVDEAAEFLRQIDAQAQAWAGKVLNTGNPVMDAIVMEKEAAALKQGVRFEKEISVLPNLPIRPISWVALLGNALDNALEACAKLKEPQRFIRLTLRGHGNYLSIDIQNPCAGNARYPFRTSKKDAQHHGLGIASMRSAAARYGGDISIGCKDHLFSVHVDFWNLSPERTKREAVHSSSEETP